MIEKNVLAIFLNGPISKNSILISKIFNNKVMVIIFIFIGIHQLYLNMRPIECDKIHFTFLCRFSKKAIFSFLFIFILMVDRNRKHFNPYFTYENLKKKWLKMISLKKLNSHHKGLRW